VATIIARPDAGPASSDTSDDTLPLQAALDAARPGDVVALLPGRYVNPVTVRFGGTSEDPLVIRGLPGAVIDGGQAPHLTRLTPPRAGGLWPPTWDDFAFFKARSVSASSSGLSSTRSTCLSLIRFAFWLSSPAA